MWKQGNIINDREFTEEYFRLQAKVSLPMNTAFPRGYPPVANTFIINWFVIASTSMCGTK
jgi:hypothetical protein